MSIQATGVKPFEIGDQKQNPALQEGKYDRVKITLGVICTLALLATAATLIYMSVMKGNEASEGYSRCMSERYVIHEGAIHIETSHFFEVAGDALDKSMLFASLAVIPLGAAAMKVVDMRDSYKNDKEMVKDVVLTMIALAALAATIYWATQLKAETVPKHYWGPINNDVLNPLSNAFASTIQG